MLIFYQLHLGSPTVAEEHALPQESWKVSFHSILIKIILQMALIEALLLPTWNFTNQASSVWISLHSFIYQAPIE